MSRQRRRDTGPEIELRRLLHSLGARYRVNWPVPGIPRRTIDIAFTRRHLAVFIDGCFWHSCPEHGTRPRANEVWWAEKLASNHRRDQATTTHLRELGWTVVRIWEHEDPNEAVTRILKIVRPGTVGQRAYHALEPAFDSITCDREGTSAT